MRAIVFDPHEYCSVVPTARDELRGVARSTMGGGPHPADMCVKGYRVTYYRRHGREGLLITKDMGVKVYLLLKTWV